MGDSWSLSLYGGYSESNIDHVTTDITEVRGEGHFMGGQITKTVRETAAYRLQLSAGWLYQSSDTRHEIYDRDEDKRELQFSMPSLTVGYASRRFDALGGRNFLSNTLLFNFADKLGSSTAEEYETEGRAGADGDFVVSRFSAARLQRFFRGEDAPGRWTLFMKVEGQVSSDTLTAQITKSIGGANTVRGYEEQEAYGDQAIVGSIELRTPMWHNFIPGLKKSDEFLDLNPQAWQRHRLQFLTFLDYGYVDIKHPRFGEQEDEAMLSAGLGVRLGLTKYTQARADYAYPFLEASDITPNDGRFHLSLQLQF